MRDASHAEPLANGSVVLDLRLRLRRILRPATALGVPSLLEAVPRLADVHPLERVRDEPSTRDALGPLSVGVPGSSKVWMKAPDRLQGEARQEREISPRRGAVDGCHVVECESFRHPRERLRNLLVLHSAEMVYAQHARARLVDLEPP